MCISYCWRKSRTRCREKVFLTNQLILPKRLLASESDSVKAEILELETVLSPLFNLELEGLKFQSRIRWLGEGETPSRFFLNMGNQRREKSYVSSILNSDNAEVYSLEELLTVRLVYNVNVERDNWEPRLSKLDKMISSWRSRSLSLVGKVVVMLSSSLPKITLFCF